MKAIRVHQTGGLEALELVDLDLPEPGEGEALIRIEAVGVNFIDIYHRTGLYPKPLPFTPGSEAAGVVEAVGPGVTELQPGDRVAGNIPDTYAEYTVAPAERLVPLPDDVDARTAAAAMLQGMTAHYLVTSTFPLGAGHTALVHAAAGGTGALLVQMAKLRGAQVFGTASTAKLDIAREAGVDEAIDYTAQDFEQEVLRLTEGAGVNVVYDSVGKTTFDRSLNCVTTRGTLVMFGQSSGPVPPFDPLRLSKRSVFLTRPTLAHHTRDREEIRWRARELLGALASGTLRLRIDRELPLAEAAQAHSLLEGRQTAGKLLLIP